jgi:hypothetical protein
MSTWILALQSPAKSYLKVSSKLLSPLSPSAVVERRLISGAKVRRNLLKCQFASHVMKSPFMPKSNLLQNSNDNMPVNYILGPRINDLPTLLEN